MQQDQILLKYHDVIITIVVLYLMKVFGEISSHYIKKFFVKTVDTNYITVGQCTNCKKVQAESDREFKKEIRESFAMLKGVLVVMAAGQKPSIEELKDLFK